MKHQTGIRIAIDIIIAISVIWGWWFVALPLGIVAFWALPYYVELLIAGFVFDALFGLGRDWGIWGYAGTIAAFASAGVIHVMKIVVRR